LTAAERAVAPVLFATLRETVRALAGGVVAADALATAREGLAAAGFGVDYLALVDGSELAPIETAQAGARLIVAARLGAVRLLDNVGMG
jgi:pantoate--beta-alanine ligase